MPFLKWFISYDEVGFAFRYVFWNVSKFVLFMFMNNQTTTAARHGMIRLYAAEELENTPSRQDGIDASKEFRYFHEATCFIRHVARQLDM